MDERIAQNLEEIRQRIARAELAAGREVGSVELMAVSKTFPASDVLIAHQAGQRVFGENRVQEGEEKIPICPADAKWHLIGPLQRNKIRKALSVGFEFIDAVDSFKLAEAISRVAGEMALNVKILLEVNVGGEETKHGFSSAELREVFGKLIALPNLTILGLMTIPPPVDEVDEARTYFREVRELRDALELEFCVKLPELSMGMSHDFEAAIAEGSTCVRVGTAIFGRR